MSLPGVRIFSGGRHLVSFLGSSPEKPLLPSSAFPPPAHQRRHRFPLTCNWGGRERSHKKQRGTTIPKLERETGQWAGESKKEITKARWTYTRGGLACEKREGVGDGSKKKNLVTFGQKDSKTRVMKELLSVSFAEGISVLAPWKDVSRKVGVLGTKERSIQAPPFLFCVEVWQSVLLC